MKRVKIENFGAVKNVVIDIDKNIQVYIGAQASGKSTICKIIYFCKKIRDYLLEFLMDTDQFNRNHPNEYYNNFLKFLTKQFMGCFGTTKHMNKFVIRYEFNQSNIQIKLNEDGYVRFSFNPLLKDAIVKIIDETASLLEKSTNITYGDELFSVLDKVSTMNIMKVQLRKLVFEIFNDDMDIIYIPAGRSLLASMSEQLHGFSITDMDLTMQEFINLITTTKNKFGSKIPDMVVNYTKTVKGQINNSATDYAYLLIKQILKADYTSENDGEKIYFDENHWVKLMFGSSGQQEALWILMIAFAIILEKKKSFIVIEEPEAHLFPIAQKEIINLIALLVNTTDSQVVITTHSPYILTSINILLYSWKVENSKKIQSELTIIPKSIRLSSYKFAAYVIENRAHDNNFIMQSLLDNETGLIDTEYIDKVSEITNDDLEKLIELETKYDL
ncbi:AAA family ATPase [Anaerocolumna sp. AGMB13020]|uniref:AAA family ATPase n=1 Tax=Anaerocolumna sp. AGMB13020 TaxID=3081750 RepID=UPI002954BE7A|nr:AAA family ATPase [Anaerocolumna sp. AGMB13020]WOO36071.1 AAA family ATPase [Anaerocolumna sp. AGMB13020]